MKRLFVAAVLLSTSMPFAARAASNEVPLHIEAIGEVQPDVMTIGLSQQTQASSQAAADSALDRQHGDLLKRMGELGVAAGDVTWVRDAVQAPGSTDTIDTEADGAKAPAPTFYANATGTITLRDASKLPVVLALPSDVATINSRAIHYSFADERAARTLAVQRGFANARRDAEAYAAAAQMRIGRIERISSARSPFSATDMQQMIAKFAAAFDRKAFPGDIFSSVTAAVVVDYVLVP